MHRPPGVMWDQAASRELSTTHGRTFAGRAALCALDHVISEDSMTAILGISAFYHDSAAALVVDGTIVAAAQEERFTRIKHDDAFPKNAAAYSLAEGGLQPEDLDYVVFYEKPLRKFE